MVKWTSVWAREAEKTSKTKWELNCGTPCSILTTLFVIFLILNIIFIIFISFLIFMFINGRYMFFMVICHTDTPIFIILNELIIFKSVPRILGVRIRGFWPPKSFLISTISEGFWVSKFADFDPQNPSFCLLSLKDFGGQNPRILGAILAEWWH